MDFNDRANGSQVYGRAGAQLGKSRKNVRLQRNAFMPNRNPAFANLTGIAEGVRPCKMRALAALWAPTDINEKTEKQ
jgi:hypothetical protein